MKKVTNIILLAVALVMGLTQCKKNNEQNAVENGGEKVYITLDVNQGSGSRLDVDPPHVIFENGDKIYVTSNGAYVGYLEYNGTNFGGEISDATEGMPLYFYLLKPKSNLQAGATTCTVSISDQRTDKPVIACNASNENFGETTAFTSTLRNKCALVKFNVTTSSSTATCITGFNNKLTVDFSTNTLTPSKEGAGNIYLGAGSGEKWAILLPQEALGTGKAFSGSYHGTRGAIPRITENGYLSSGIEVTVNTSTPTGATPGLFTINADGDLAYFSNGNLQYIGSASTPYWKFADNQWDYLGSTTGQNYTYNINVDRDLFAWGTSGYNHGAVCYQPWNFGGNNYYDYFAYGESNYNLYDQTGQADWGYNAISNGGNTPGQWRTLTKEEWQFIISNRNTISGWSYHYAKTDPGNVEGVLLFPDDWAGSKSGLASNVNAPSTVHIQESSWINLANAGVVFLPCAGYLNQDSEFVSGNEYYEYGRYWTATACGGYTKAYNLSFSSGSSPVISNFPPERLLGNSVRLVQDAN